MSELYLVRLWPDMAAFAPWAVRRGLLRTGVDEGYAWHALLKAVLGDTAPKPFVLRRQGKRAELLGYCRQDPLVLPVLAQDPEAVHIVGLEREPESRLMPLAWQRDQLLSFEVRVRPVVRARSGRDASSVEVDAAVHAFRRDAAVTREAAYEAWLRRELARDGAAQLHTYQPARFLRSRVMRPDQSREDGKKRQRRTVEGPDLTVRGELSIGDPQAFSSLLARGIGRHRAFGFGCLLLAPPGVLR